MKTLFAIILICGITLVLIILRAAKHWDEPRPCKIHGTKYLYQHGYHDDWDCLECKMKQHEDWMSKREDYRDGKQILNSLLMTSETLQTIPGFSPELLEQH